MKKKGNLYVRTGRSNSLGEILQLIATKRRLVSFRSSIYAERSKSFEGKRNSKGLEAMYPLAVIFF